MDWGQLIGTIASVLCSAIVGLVSASIKKSVSRMEEDIKKNATDNQELWKEFNDLKADLPFVYVLREDFVRSLNNVDKNIADMNGKLDRVLETIAKGGNSSG